MYIYCIYYYEYCIILCTLCTLTLYKHPSKFQIPSPPTFPPPTFSHHSSIFIHLHPHFAHSTFNPSPSTLHPLSTAHLPTALTALLASPSAPDLDHHLARHSLLNLFALLLSHVHARRSLKPRLVIAILSSLPEDKTTSVDHQR